MGRDFRDSRYYRYCWIGKRTIKEGEACVVWNRKGAHRVVRGPYLKRMFFTSIRFMDRYTCNDKEYLEVCFRDGHTEHVKGPVSLFCNFVKHKSVNVRPAIELKSPVECLVVNYHTSEAKSRWDHEPGAREHDTVNDDEAPAGFASKTAAAHDVISTESDAMLSSNAGHNVRVSQAESKVKREVILGPCVYFPRAGDEIQSNEWVKRMWEQRLESCKETKSRTAFRDSIMLLCPQNFTVPLDLNVSGFFFGTINIGLHFQVVNALSLLDNSLEPYSDMQYAAQADLANFASYNICSGAKRRKQNNRHLEGNEEGDEVANAECTGSESEPTPLSFEELLFELETSIGNPQSEFLSQIANKLRYANLQQVCATMGIKVLGMSFLSFEPAQEASYIRSQQARSLEARLTREANVKQKQNEHEQELKRKQRALELEVQETKFRLESKRKQLEDEQKLAHDELKHSLMLKQAKEAQEIESQKDFHAQCLQVAQKKNDEVLRLIKELQVTNKDIDVTSLLQQFTLNPNVDANVSVPHKAIKAKKTKVHNGESSREVLANPDKLLRILLEN